MKVKELIRCCHDKIIIYTSKCIIVTDKETDEVMFQELYKGNAENIPSNILDMTVRCFGAKRKGVIDICVRN